MSVLWEVREHAGWLDDHGHFTSSQPPPTAPPSHTIILPPASGVFVGVRINVATARYFSIRSIHVGREELLGLELPAECFLADSPDAPIHWGTFVTAGSIRLVVANNSEEEQEISGFARFRDGRSGAEHHQSFNSVAPGSLPPRVHDLLWRGSTPALQQAVVLLREKPWLNLERALLVALVDGEEVAELELPATLARWAVRKAAGEFLVGGWCRRCCDEIRKGSLPIVRVGGRSFALDEGPAPLRGPCASCERALALWWRGEVRG